MNNKYFTIITFYQFKIIKDKNDIITKLKDFCKFNKIKGTILIADEGINGTIAGLEKNINSFILYLENFNFEKLNLKRSKYKYMPFQKLKIRNKNEIVTLRTKFADPTKISGKKVKYNEWNQLIKDKDTIVIDVRNEFEVKIGSFEGAINPKTKSFTDFKSFVQKKLNKSKDKKIAMFCTGGIRCEKASSYMMMKGFKNVAQLDGGILKYLEKTPKKDSMWNGECFVFDGRVSLKNELKDGTYKLCHACRLPISIKDTYNKYYEPGLSCHNCFDKTSLEKKKNLLERNKQITIAKKRGVFNRYIKQSILEYE